MRSLHDDPRAEAGARATAALWLRGRLRATVLLMQLRTRVIDDDVEAFASGGGKQLVLLGAGFDCRAWRLGRALASATVYEVDHPATQARKRAVMEGEPTPARVVFVPWNFESEPLDRLPARLGLDGHDARAPSMTISEGVLPYLSDDAVDATFACIARYSAPGSRVSFTYLERALLADRSRHAVGERVAVRLLGEPFRHGFEPQRLAGWLETRGFRLEHDESGAELAARMFAADEAAVRLMANPHRARRHFASARLA
jgi:methyltransferase (TIGR00027 family)